MKQNLYKIIAIATVMLGALGPQVASGSTQSNLSNQTVQENSNFVVNSHDSGTNYSMAVSYSTTQLNVGLPQREQSCGVSDDDSTPIQFLLWQGCNSLDIAQDQPLQHLVVVNQPTITPSLAMQSTQSFNPYIAINSTSSAENSVLPGSGISLKVSAGTTSFEPNSIFTSGASILQTAQIQQITFQNIVMRC